MILPLEKLERGRIALAIFEGYKPIATPDDIARGRQPSFYNDGNGKSFFIYNTTYHNSYNSLIPVYIRFRDLRIPPQMFIEYSIHIHNIIRAFSDGLIEELFSAIVDAVEWYNKSEKEVKEIQIT